MGEYRHKETGEVKTQGEWRQHYKNVSLPRVWAQETLESLNLDAVFETPKPDAGKYEIAVRNGVVKDEKDNWVQSWAVVNMFSTYIDEEGAVHTKDEQEAVYQAGLDGAASESVRAERNRKLAETDWMALSDVVMSPEMTAYRQALRDVSDQVGFPHNIVWPTKP